MAEPIDMMLPLPREIRAEIAALRNETGERFAALEAGQRSIRSALAANTVLSRMLIGSTRNGLRRLRQKSKPSKEVSKVPSASLAAQLGSIRAKRLAPEEYLRHLVELAGLDACEARPQDIADLQRIRSLRQRLNALERKVSELEALK